MTDETNGSGVREREHHPDCPARYFTDHPERCRCVFMAMLDHRPATPAADDASDVDMSWTPVDRSIVDAYQPDTSVCHHCTSTVSALVECPIHPASTGASEGLSEAEVTLILDCYRAAGPSEPNPLDICHTVERIVAARESAAATRARAEERERIAVELDYRATAVPEAAAAYRVAARVARGDA